MLYHLDGSYCYDFAITPLKGDNKSIDTPQAVLSPSWGTVKFHRAIGSQQYQIIVAKTSFANTSLNEEQW